MPHPTVPINPDELTRDTLAKFNARTTPTDSGCLLWTGERHPSGYGRFTIGEHKFRAHRVAYVQATGHDIPPGMVIDHLCRNRACVNADHLELATDAVNTARGNSAAGETMRSVAETGTCRRGHDMSLPDAWIWYTRSRGCRRCQAESNARSRARLAAARKA